jgi:DNA end-binding protein Ku
MPRAMWSGSIAFGLVNIPVKMYTAVQPKDVHFHQLHDADGARIQQKRICPVDETEVSFAHIVKGYEITKGRHVVIAPEELRALDPRATGTIDIDRFVDQSEIDPLHYEHSYYLGPDRGAAKAYILLLHAMEKAGKAALGRVVLRTKEYRTLIRPHGRVLAMETLLYADEVVSPDEIEVPGNVKLDEREVAMAVELVGALAGPFAPAEWHDEYRERVLDLIQRKAEGAEIVLQPAAAERPAPVVDLVAALRASLEKTANGGRTRAARAQGRQPPDEEAPREPQRATKAARHGHARRGRKSA